MRLLLCFALVQAGLGQTINTTGTFNWEQSTSWSEGVLPTLATAVNSPFNTVVIEGGAQVYLVASANALSLFSPVQIGGSATASASVDATTTLTLTSRALQTTALKWYRGHIMMNGTASAFRVAGGILLSGDGDVTCNGTDDRFVEGGSFQLGNAIVGSQTIWVNGGSVWFKGATLDASASSASGQVVVAAQAAVKWSGQCAVASAVTLKGAGQVVVDATADVAVNADVTLQTAKTDVQGNLTVAVGKTVNVVGAGTELVVEQGGRVQRTASSATAHIAVQAGASLRFGASAAMTGKASVEGGLCDIRSGAKAVVDAGVGLLASDLSFQANATLALNFQGGTSFATATVSGALTIAAGAVLQLSGTEPTATVTLATAGTLSGKFDEVWVNGVVVYRASASAGRRLLSGSVTYNSNSIEYHPGTSPAPKAQYIVALLAPAMALLW
jgi:hypothetical protein